MISFSELSNRLDIAQVHEEYPIPQPGFGGRRYHLVLEPLLQEDAVLLHGDAEKEVQHC